MKHILAAVDGSKPSYGAFEYATKLARGLGAELTLLVDRKLLVGRRDVSEIWSNEQAQSILGHAKQTVTAEGGLEPAIAEEGSRVVAFRIVDRVKSRNERVLE